MTWLPDSTLNHLREVADWPDLSATRYEVIEPIGRGGMGTVYRARDRELDRQVALKVLRTPGLPDAAAARLTREAKILARLEHPGIVPVHDAAVLPDGRIYYAMKLVRGSRLDQEAGRTGSLVERLRIFGRICEAVAFAHAHGVIHRDLKPQNIMVGPFGEVLVMDWGLARLESDPPPEVRSDSSPGPSGDSTADTAQGTVLGTPGYMAPEQARGDVGRVDQRSDVYALGGILYFLLTGEAPPARGTPDPPRRRDLSTPRPLEAICLKALDADPARRYPRAEDLAADVARFRAGLAVAAYPEGPLDRALRLATKYRAPLLLVLAYLLMRVLLLLFAGN